MTEHAAPRHLSAESRRLWRETTRVYELEARHLAILLCALEAFDRMREAQAAVKADGAYVDGRFGMKSHPGLAVERDSRLAFLRAQRELGLDLEAPAASRPPSRWRP
jgi:phage terminase small subunit